MDHVASAKAEFTPDLQVGLCTLLILLLSGLQTMPGLFHHGAGAAALHFAGVHWRWPCLRASLPGPFSARWAACCGIMRRAERWGLLALGLMAVSFAVSAILVQLYLRTNAHELYFADRGGCAVLLLITGVDFCFIT